MNTNKDLQFKRVYETLDLHDVILLFLQECSEDSYLIETFQNGRNQKRIELGEKSKLRESKLIVKINPELFDTDLRWEALESLKLELEQNSQRIVDINRIFMFSDFNSQYRLVLELLIDMNLDSTGPNWPKNNLEEGEAFAYCELLTQIS